MEILRNQTMLRKQDDKYIAAELSNVATVLQTPQLFADYFQIDADASITLPGLKNVEEYIGPHSSVMYNEVENLPVGGLDNLVVQSQYDDETGFDEEFQTSGIIYPNTIVPKPGDCFFLKGAKRQALYVVTNVINTTVRSNPFVEISIRLFSRDPEVFAQLRRQVRENYVTTVTSLGADKTLVIKRDAYFEVQKHIKNYIDIADLYKMLFFNRSLSAFVFDGIYDEQTERRLKFVDMTLWRLMFDEGIVIFDSIITYSNNNMETNCDPIFTSCPDIYVDDYLYKRSILYRLYSKDTKHQVDEFKFPQSYEPDPRIGKFYGKNFVYFEHYGDKCDCNPMCLQCPTWDEEFVARLKDGVPYDEVPLNSGYCTGCNNFCDGKPATPYNPYLRNVIINWYNGKPIDWDGLQLEEKRSCENYFLIPILLGAYKSYIASLQN